MFKMIINIDALLMRSTMRSRKLSIAHLTLAIFGRVGRLASVEVVLHLIKAKCLPVLLYGLDVCPVKLSDMRSFEFTVKRTMINCCFVPTTML